MGFIILIIVAIIVAVVISNIFIFLHIYRRRLKSLEQRDYEYIKRQERAVWGKALVIDSRGGTTGETGSQALIDLTLEVTLGEDATYRTPTRWLVDITALGFIQQGQEISVKADMENPKIIYPNSPWAKYVHNHTA